MISPARIPSSSEQSTGAAGGEPTAGGPGAPRNFLTDLSPAAREQLLALGTSKLYRARATLFHQGEPSRHVVVIESGWVKVTCTSPHGYEALLAIRSAGDVLGELSAIDGQPRLATVQAIDEVRARVITVERLHAYLAQSPETALSLLRHLASRLREADSRRAQYGASDGASRLAALLLELAERSGEPTDQGLLIGLPLSQREMAASIGVSREVVARSLRILRSRGIVTTAGRRTVVLRPDLLRAIAVTVPMFTDRP
jgi:CRP/FNR family cyclic AMP-dependent transcriptional regulator